MGVTLALCVTLVTNINVYVALVNKCVIGDLLVTHFNKVWVVEGGAKSDYKAFGRLLCSRPKAKTLIVNYEYTF
jgi:hypothetical protein